MNFYKRLIKNRNTRLSILSFFKFIPDKLMIKLQYRIKTGRKLNLKKPMRYTEKIQWYKLNYRKKIMTTCSDKFEVRKYVENCGCSEILNTLYASYDNVDDIDFEQLPNSFAIKMNVGSGMNYFVLDKNKEDLKQLKKTIAKWFATDSSSYGREWCYYDIKPRIIFEKLLPMNKDNDLPDYKFFCFNGKPFCLYTMTHYATDHSKGRLGFFDTSFTQLPYYRKDFKRINTQIKKPKSFEKMLKYARILSKGFPHVRVDFYDVNGQVVFGELTFYSASGY